MSRVNSVQADLSTRTSLTHSRLDNSFHADSSSDTSSSLDRKYSNKEFDPVLFDILLVKADHIAAQMTIADAPLFKALMPEELSSIGWQKENKQKLSPNVVRFSWRFNEYTNWCQREILDRSTAKQRGDVVSHFIRVCRKLLELNNIHSAYAIFAALKCQPIFRLKHTWEHVSSKDQTTLTKLGHLFSENSNYENFRLYVDKQKLPCIPFLGIYLTDLFHIDTVHPKSDPLQHTQRDHLINNILRVISHFQTSDYSHLERIACVQNYLKERATCLPEFQKCVEDELYRKSLEVEPSQASNKNISRRASQPNFMHNETSHLKSVSLLDEQESHEDAIKASKLKSLSLKSENQMGSFRARSLNAYKSLRHRKVQSLGNSQSFKNLGIDLSTIPSTAASSGYSSVTSYKTHLLDDSIIIDQNAKECCDFTTATNDCRNGFDNPACMSALMDRNMRYMPGNRPYSPVPFDNDNGEMSNLESCRMATSEIDCGRMALISSEGNLSSMASIFEYIEKNAVMQGAVRRRTLLKRHRQPKISPRTWTKYWMCLHDSDLYFYPQKTLIIKQSDQRQAYKNDPCKRRSLNGYMIVLQSAVPEGFIMQNPMTGDKYDFRCSSEVYAREWVALLNKACLKHRPKIADNLITLEP